MNAVCKVWRSLSIRYICTIICIRSTSNSLINNRKKVFSTRYWPFKIPLTRFIAENYGFRSWLLRYIFHADAMLVTNFWPVTVPLSIFNRPNSIISPWYLLHFHVGRCNAFNQSLYDFLTVLELILWPFSVFWIPYIKEIKRTELCQGRDNGVSNY